MLPWRVTSAPAARASAPAQARVDRTIDTITVTADGRFRRNSGMLVLTGDAIRLILPDTRLGLGGIALRGRTIDQTRCACATYPRRRIRRTAPRKCTPDASRRTVRPFL